MRISLSISGPRGHLSAVTYGDDGKIHFTAHRRQGDPDFPKIVEIGKYHVTLAELETFIQQAKAAEQEERKRREHP